MRRILITNDDGIGADGIIRLARAAVGFGEVWVVAPDGQRSAQSQSITMRAGVTVRPASFPVEGVRAFACTGTPADCVRIGILNIVPGRPDTVLAGINNGYNVASDLQYSATAGAAFEAVFQKVSAIAFSEAEHTRHAAADRYLLPVLRDLISRPAEEGRIWNVNFPDTEEEACRGILYDRTVSKDPFYEDRYRAAENGDGSITYLLDGIRNYTGTEGTDLRAVIDGYVSVGTVAHIL